MKLSAIEIKTLSEYQFIQNDSFKLEPVNTKKNKFLLGIKGHSIVKIDRKDVTCFNRFLSLLHLGKLAGVSLSLNAICSHLERYEWKQISENEPQAFKTVCQIAGRCLIKNQFILTIPRLLKKVSTIYEKENSQEIYYTNPHLTLRELRAQQLIYRVKKMHFLERSPQQFYEDFITTKAFDSKLSMENSQKNCSLKGSKVVLKNEIEKINFYHIRQRHVYVIC